MAKLYEVLGQGSAHDVLHTSPDVEDARRWAEAYASVDQFTGFLDIVEVEEDPPGHRSIPMVVSTIRG